MPALPLFTFTSLFYLNLIWTESNLVAYLETDYALFFGLFWVVLSSLLGVLKKFHYQYTYDLYAFGCVLIWFAYWRRFFRLDAPIFSLYPIFFVVLSLSITYLVINRSQYLASDQIMLMRLIHKYWLFQAPLLAFVMLCSFLDPEHYLIYPIMMSFFFVRFAFSVITDNFNA